MRARYKKGLTPTALEGKRGLHYVENKSVIPGGGRRSSKKMKGIRWQKGSRASQDSVKKGNERCKVFQFTVTIEAIDYSHVSMVINCTFKYCWKMDCSNSKHADLSDPTHTPGNKIPVCPCYPKERWPSAVTGLCIGIVHIVLSRVLRLEFIAFT